MTDYLEKAVEAAYHATPQGSKMEARFAVEAAEPSIAEHHRADERARVRVEERLELDVLCGELRHIAEKGCVPRGPKEGLAIDVLTWAEAWFLQLSADLNSEPNQGDQESAPEPKGATE